MRLFFCRVVVFPILGRIFLWRLIFLCRIGVWGICFCFVETNLCACRFGVRGREFKGEKECSLVAPCFPFPVTKRGRRICYRLLSFVDFYCFALLLCFPVAVTWSCWYTLCSRKFLCRSVSSMHCASRTNASVAMIVAMIVLGCSR